MNKNEPILTSNQIDVLKWMDRHTKFNLCDKIYVIENDWFESIVQHKNIVTTNFHEKIKTENISNSVFLINLKNNSHFCSEELYNMLSEYFLKPIKAYIGYITYIDEDSKLIQAYINPHLTEIYLRINNEIIKKETSIFLHPSYTMNQIITILSRILQFKLSPNHLYFRKSNLLEPETAYHPNGIQYNAIIVDFTNENEMNNLSLQIQHKYDIKLGNCWYVGVLMNVNNNSLTFKCTYDRREYEFNKSDINVRIKNYSYYTPPVNKNINIYDYIMYYEGDQWKEATIYDKVDDKLSIQICEPPYSAYDVKINDENIHFSLNNEYNNLIPNINPDEIILDNYNKKSYVDDDDDEEEEEDNEDASIFTSGAVGITNIGNTCYMNSMLQCLCHSKDLVDFFVDRIGVDSLINEKYCVFLNEFIQFLIKIYKPTKRYIDINKFRKSFISIVPDFDDNNQHDTSEFMDYILNTLDDALKQYELFIDEKEEEKLTIIQYLFRSKLKSIIKCDVCSSTSESSETFLYFSLSIPKEYHYIRIIYYSTNIIPPTYFILKTLANSIDSIIDEFCQEYNIDKNKIFYPCVVNKYIYDSHNVDSLPQDLYNFELYLFNRIDSDDFNDLELDNIDDNNNNGNESPNVLFSIQPDDLQLNESAFQPIPNTINNSNFHYCKNYTFLNFFSCVNEQYIYLYPSYVPYCETEKVLQFIMTLFDNQKEMIKNISTNPNDMNIMNIELYYEKMKNFNPINDMIIFDESYEKYNIMNNNRITLYSCLDEYFEKENIKDEWLCSKCNEKRSATKSSEILSLPKILIFHISFF